MYKTPLLPPEIKKSWKIIWIKHTASRTTLYCRPCFYAKINRTVIYWETHYKQLQAQGYYLRLISTFVLEKYGTVCKHKLFFVKLTTRRSTSIFWIFFFFYFLTFFFSQRVKKRMTTTSSWSRRNIILYGESDAEQDFWRRPGIFFFFCCYST